MTNVVGNAFEKIDFEILLLMKLKLMTNVRMKMSVTMVSKKSELSLMKLTKLDLLREILMGEGERIIFGSKLLML